MLASLRRGAVILPLALVVGGGAWFVTRDTGDPADAATEQVVDVTSGTLAQTVAAEGTIQAADTDDLSFDSAGTVTAVNIAAGDDVKAGQVLATIDSAELQADVTQAEASLADAQAKLADDEDASSSDAQIDADTSNVASAQSSLAAANDALAGAQLVATIDGTVAAVNITIGEELGSSGTSGVSQTGTGSGSGQSSSDLGSSGSSANQGQSSQSQTGSTSTQGTSSDPQVEVVSSGSYVVDLSLDDTEIDLVEKGQKASVATGTNANGSATGQVTEVGAVADASSGVAAYPVTVAFEGDPDTFFVGADATVEITYDEIADAIQVPARAVTTTGGTSTVVVDDNGERETREVELGVSSGGMVQVTSGLKAGEKVVITFTPRSTSGGTGNNQGGQGQQGGFQPPAGFDPSQGPPGGLGGNQGNGN